MEERKSIPPIREGDELEVKIEAVGEKGDGIAKVKGFVLFVPNTKEGDSVKVRVTKVLRRVGFAEVIGEASGEEASEEEKEDFEEEAAPEDTEDFGEDTEEDTEEDDEEEEPVKKGKSPRGKKR